MSASNHLWHRGTHADPGDRWMSDAIRAPLGSQIARKEEVRAPSALPDQGGLPCLSAFPSQHRAGFSPKSEPPKEGQPWARG